MEEVYGKGDGKETDIEFALFPRVRQGGAGPLFIRYSRGKSNSRTGHEARVTVEQGTRSIVLVVRI